MTKYNFEHEVPDFVPPPPPPYISRINTYNPLFKYIVFNNSKSFEEWQINNIDKNNTIHIHQIVPLVSGFNGDISERGTSIGMETSISIFVTYVE